MGIGPLCMHPFYDHIAKISVLLPYSKSGQRALDELQRTIVEIETKYKGELSRLKKRYESEIHEFEIQIETLSRTNAELAHANKSLSGKLKVSVPIR